MQINTKNEGLYNIDPQELQVCVDLFSVFSNIDTARIFLYAKNGIPNSTKAIKDLRITPKRYYSRLKELLDSGVLVKGENGYAYTPIGEILERMGQGLIEMFRQRDRIELFLQLSKSTVLNSEEREKVTSFLGENISQGGILTPFLEGTDAKGIEKIDTYEKLVNRICEETISAKESILLASTYFDPIVAEKFVQAIQRGLQVKGMISKSMMGSKLTKLRMLLSPKALLTFVEMLRKVKNLEDMYREADLPFSFMIVDGKSCFFEFPTVGEGEFIIAFHAKDKKLTQKFTLLFNDIWKGSDASSLEILTFFRRI